MTTYLVTGGAGFVGSHLCDRLLAQGERVIAIDDLTTGRIANLAEARGYGAAFTFYNMDARSEKLGGLFDRHRPEVVMHLATRPGPSTDGPVADAERTVVGTLELLERCAGHGVRKVVYAVPGGTLYGESKRQPLAERAIAAARPISPTAISRSVVLDYLAYYERFRGLDWVALALANVYGPRQDPAADGGVVAVFTAALLAGQAPTIHGDGNQTRDFVFVADVVHAFALAAERGHGRVVNVGTGVETSVQQLFRLASAVVGTSLPPGSGPLPAGDLRRNALDPALAAEVLGWRPWTHLEDGVAETVAFLRGV
ncbi:MAG: NAD-dependent epimerase/dehydratase family protein [Actinomycetota bacterium]